MATSGSETTKGRGGSRIKRSTAAKKERANMCLGFQAWIHRFNKNRAYGWHVHMPLN